MKSAVVLAAASLGIALGASASQASAPRPIVFAADRAPLVSGEIYRVDPNGRRVDLSRSPYEDADPAVSSDGKHVAFLSTRGGRTRLFEVGIDGRGLVAAGENVPGLRAGGYTLLWQPGGDRVAVDTAIGIAIVERGHRPITIHNIGFGLNDAGWNLDAPSSWSPDGHVLLLLRGEHHLRAVAPDGRTLWTHRVEEGVGGWSAGGLIAIAVDHGVAVYDESGQLRFIHHLPSDPSWLEWSPDGSSLAVAYPPFGSGLEVLTASGRLLVKRHVPSDWITWAGDSTVVVGMAGKCGCHAIGVRVPTGQLTSASMRWLGELSADRKLASFWRDGALGAAPTRGGQPKAYGKLPRCNGQAGMGLSPFAGRSIVYESFCAAFDNLYSVDGRVHRVTNDRAEETQPALSPDGTEIAYVWARERDSRTCEYGSCPEGIRIVDGASGAPIRTLTHPTNCTFDDSPSWSPDGTTILYSRVTCDKPAGKLFTIPVGGGKSHDLNLAGFDPAWGPTRIAYEGALTGGIWTANPDGSDPTKIANKGTDPAWSPSGKLAYLVGSSSVVVGATRVHLPFASVDSLTWSADGTRFVVVARKTKDGFEDVYTVKTDGTDPLRLTKYYGAWNAMNP